MLESIFDFLFLNPIEEQTEEYQYTLKEFDDAIQHINEQEVNLPYEVNDSEDEDEDDDDDEESEE